MYLLALRPPAIAAKVTATLDVLSGGRLLFGVGVGGENPKEFELCGVPHRERGARVNEAIEVVRALWREPPARFKGRFTQFEGVYAALERAARHGDGWVSYVVQPERFAQSLAKIRAAAEAHGRALDRFTPAHLVLITLGRDYESARAAWVQRLSRRYAQDFGPLAQKYGVIGTPEQCAEQLERFRAAGCRHFLLNAICEPAEERAQLERMAAEVIPRFRPR